MQRAFTLIELSIVLIVIGLIVSAIVGGQSLIKQSKITKAIHNVKLYQSAIHLFQDEFEALPGDIDDAETYWGAGSGNGNGDGNVQNAEICYVWNHLSLADVLPTRYGFQANCLGGTPHYQTGITAPSFLHDESAIAFGITNNMGHSSDFSNLPDRKKAFIAVEANDGDFGAVTTKEAITIDKKMDDGAPMSGAVYGFNRTNGTDTCVNGAHANGGQTYQNNASYILDNDTDDKHCRMTFVF